MQYNLTHSNINRLMRFAFASAALILCGFFLQSNKSVLILTALLLCNFSGVFIIYRLNDCMNPNENLLTNLKLFVQTPFHLILSLVFIGLVIPFAFLTLNSTSLLMLIFSAMLGVFYTITLKLNQQGIRLKNIFLIKNILIGIGWGNLIIIGAGAFSPKFILNLYIFVVIQVFIGSMIRDVVDTEQDIRLNIKSFPVVMGVSNTIKFMHILNIVTGCIFALTFRYEGIALVVIVSTIWRTINIFFLAKDLNSNFWSQSGNLFTCLVILIMSIITISI